MSDGIKRAYEEEQFYLWLCKYYEETPSTRRDANMVEIVDSWGKHAQKLKKRFQSEK